MVFLGLPDCPKFPDPFRYLSSCSLNMPYKLRSANRDLDPTNAKLFQCRPSPEAFEYRRMPEHTAVVPLALPPLGLTLLVPEMRSLFRTQCRVRPPFQSSWHPPLFINVLLATNRQFQCQCGATARTIARSVQRASQLAGRQRAEMQSETVSIFLRSEPMPENARKTLG